MTPEEKRKYDRELYANRTSEQIEKDKQDGKKYRANSKNKEIAKNYAKSYNKDYVKLDYVKKKAKKYNEKRNQMSEVIDYHKIYNKDNLKHINLTKQKLNVDKRFEVCLTYSKRHSNSDIPCCRCCGENTDVRFLAIDHIQGKKNLPKSEAILGGDKLILFLKKNNFPEGYQVLCHNCNAAKGFSKNNNECPMKNKPH
jgi:hypothetical protein|tara:strand:- start:110 stop:703 length:594 start_codon:yes stop_codon:yes gene_type:complete